MKLKRYFKKIINFRDRTGITYLHSLKQPVCETEILLEAGQGKNISGNMFALLKGIERDPEWAAYTPYWVVTNGSAPSVKKIFEAYKFQKVRFLTRNSKEYEHKLATCKYLATDNNFPSYLIKRDEQVYLNTGNGTPLKPVGRSDFQNANSIHTTQKNYFSCDYALFPNEYAKDVFMQDYMLDRQYGGNIVLADYPRNAALQDTDTREMIRKEQHLEHVRTYAYMPAKRQADPLHNSRPQSEILSETLRTLDRRLQDDQIMFVKFPFSAKTAQEFQNYKHIRRFPEQYETYDFLNACDCLITDYSSVLFDFTVTKRKIILYPYDMDKSTQDLKTYLDLKELPFPLVTDENSLLREMDTKEYPSFEDFRKKYNTYTDPDITNKVLRLFIKGEKQDLNVYKCKPARPQIVWHIGTLMSQIEQQILLRLISQADYKNQDITLVVEEGMKVEKLPFLEELPKEIYVYFLSRGEAQFFKDAFHMFIFRRFGKTLGKLQDFFEREYHKLFYRWKINELHFMFAKSLKFYYMYRQQNLKIYYHNFPARIRKFVVLTRGWFHRREEDALNNSAAIIEYEDDFADDILHDLSKFSTETNARLKHIKTQRRSDGLFIDMRLYIRTLKTEDPEHFRIRIGNRIYDPQIKATVSQKKYYNTCSGHYAVTLPFEDCGAQDFQNKIYLVHECPDNEGNIWEKKTRITRSRLFVRLQNLKPQKLYQTPDEKLCLFFRYLPDTLTLTIRNSNVTDQTKERIKLTVARYLAKVMFWWHPILLFEKNSARYEESGSAVYEELINEGYQNAYFILEKDYPFRDQIPEKYRKNIIDKYSLRHYLCFFRTRTFIGTEAELHALELRPFDENVVNHVKRTPHTYVFLQHGVMYMISLDADTRTAFVSHKKSKTERKVVVSSELEAKHFTDLGNFERDKLYLCGLPKFDRVIWKPDADKIVIMITWRPWDAIQMYEDMTKTTYYRMLKNILNAVPENFRDRLYVLPHPLVETVMKANHSEFTKYIPAEMKYDTILQETKVLITDYSSISYDAFYRGANVIFCWQEKEECLKHYGPKAKLMLTKELAFGDVNYDFTKLHDLIQDNYTRGQKQEHLDNYRQIVEFHDGHNSRRLVEFLKRDKII